MPVLQHAEIYMQASLVGDLLVPLAFATLRDRSAFVPRTYHQQGVLRTLQCENFCPDPDLQGSYLSGLGLESCFIHDHSLG